MVIFVLSKRRILSILIILFFLISIFAAYDNIAPVWNAIVSDEEDKNMLSIELKTLFDSRNRAILDKDLSKVASFYDTNTKYGVWAYEYEERKMKYIHKWSDKQGIKFTDIQSTVVVRKAKKRDNKCYANLLVSTQYKYSYENSPDIENTFRIGTYHVIDIERRDDKCYITREWYTDPFADSMKLDNIKSEEIKNFIISQPARDLSGINKRRIDAVDYAYRYCGAASDEQYGYKYNKKYRDFNPEGGDCANFASQILYEGGKFKKTKGWNYSRGNGSKAWLNAQGFKDYMLGSGRASLIACGSFNKIYKLSYKLLPGDIVAYEKKGKVTHVSTVTGTDSKGYTLVTCHNTDRCGVPWDLGWSNKDIKFWLIRVHY